MNSKNIRPAIILFFLFLMCGNSFATLIISQYYEGRSRNKWIELYNSGPDAIDLSQSNISFAVWTYPTNGWRTNVAPVNSFKLSGIVSSKGTFLIGDSQATAPSYATSDLVGNYQLLFNGNDSVAIYHDDYSVDHLIDIIAFPNSMGYFGKDISFVRKETITQGVHEDFNIDDWETYSYSDVNVRNNSSRDLGIHYTSSSIPEPATVSLLLVAILSLVGFRKRK